VSSLVQDCFLTGLCFSPWFCFGVCVYVYVCLCVYVYLKIGVHHIVTTAGAPPHYPAAAVHEIPPHHIESNQISRSPSDHFLPPPPLPAAIRAAACAAAPLRVAAAAVAVAEPRPAASAAAVLAHSDCGVFTRIWVWFCVCVEG